MKATLALALFALLTVACSGGTPTSPSRVSSADPAPAPPSAPQPPPSPIPTPTPQPSVCTAADRAVTHTTTSNLSRGTTTHGPGYTSPVAGRWQADVSGFRASAVIQITAYERDEQNRPAATTAADSFTGRTAGQLCWLGQAGVEYGVSVHLGPDSTSGETITVTVTRPAL